MGKYKLFTFNSTHQALLTEKNLKELGYPVRLIPVPRSISASCGLAARVNLEDLEAVLDIIRTHNIDIAGTYDF